ncbi:lipopolysaccharide biosynthesis protein [Sphingomonas sp. M1-B02]|uniref:lipopolysaccharide biosynthesis protein n=1 Tax=Sphingomonas sp. M1-B02 TaxID=3114300 RepID=UPI00223F94F7|nr:lipopolysaccharide biosynthesis protein [Sphingomonas sp. S6-11]UZK66972.1 lipopolysaccharide biosynthesis protein [Sphingomonas sp. S6-11]
MKHEALQPGEPERPGALLARVRQAVIWRSGSQIVAQAVAWGATFMVIRLLDPADYGLFAMTQVVLVFLNLMNGYGIASALIRAEQVSRLELRQVFGMLLLLNLGLGLAQFAAAPWIAAYYRQDAVAALLRVQALLYIATPFIALAHAILSRRMDFKRPAQVRLLSALAGAGTALGCALAGFGVWTLVAAPMAIFYVEAIGMTWAARSLMWPSFRFRGSGGLFGYGAAMMLAQFFWFLQSQADVLIAGRVVDPHSLGIYTTALFLTQIIASKFVPPLNEVAFAAYSRVQGQSDVMQGAFLKTVRLIMLVAMPAYMGLAVTAGPLVATMLGEKWLETAAIVPILALAMPLLTLQILFAPATNALGKPGISLRASMAGGVVLPAAFLIGVHYGIAGLAWGWLGGMALVLAFTAMQSLPAIGVRARDVVLAVAPGVLASLAMAGIVIAVDGMLPTLPPAERLVLLIGAGAASYAALLFLFARSVVNDAWSLIRTAAPA